MCRRLKNGDVTPVEYSSATDGDKLRTHNLDESPETYGGEPGGGDPRGSMFYDSIYVTFSEC